MKALPMSKEPINRATPPDESEPVVSLNDWQTRIRAISEGARRNLLAIIFTAAALSATSTYFALQSRSISLQTADLQGRNERPEIAIINADVEGFGEEKISLSLEFKNLETRTAHSLAIGVVGFDPKTEKVRQLTQIASTAPMRHDTSVNQSIFVKRSEMLPVLILCLLYADEDKRGFSEHLYYDAPDASKISGRIELRKLAGEAHKRADELKICLM
jgi:hypothetical protein